MGTMYLMSDTQGMQDNAGNSGQNWPACAVHRAPPAKASSCLLPSPHPAHLQEVYGLAMLGLHPQPPTT